MHCACSERENSAERDQRMHCMCSAHVREWRAVKGEKGAGEMGWVVKPLCRWL